MGTSRASVEGRHLVLVGMMGVGKTSVGRLVAARLGREFVDTDAAVQVRTGRSVRELFESFGEAAFRDAESEALAAALGRSEPAVIAAGGGAVLRRENRELLAGATVVWLRAGLATLLGRVGSGTHRPLLDTDPVGVL
ncbi:MAG: hypothetical protein C4344_02140, partial [Acidimicrobiia bacterium]